MLALSETVSRAAACYQSGDIAEAERLCRTVLEADADHFNALLLLGLLEHQRKNEREAHRLVGHALRVNQASPEALAIHGAVLRALHRYEEALASYDRALAIRPDFVDALYNRGNMLQDLGRYGEALASYDKALAIAPRDAAVHNNRGIVLQELGRYEEALECYARALDVRPDYAEALNNRGNSLQALGYHEQALASFDRAIAIRPDYAEALSNRGNALQALGRHEEALASYDAAIGINPDHAEALNNRSVVLRALERHEEALASCDRALGIRPEYAEALRNRGSALQALGRHEEALACHERAFSIQPDARGALAVGNALQALNRHEEALAIYDKALSIKPDYAEAFNNRGNALQGLNRHEEALESYARAIALKPNDAEAHWNEGLTRLAMGDYERGWEKYEWRWQNRKLALPQRYSDQPAWLGTRDVAGRTILLYPEQGYGDAIQFIRYAPMVAALGARVVVACQETLRKIFETVEGVQSVVTPEQALPAHDCHAALMSLPLAFRTTLNTIPARIPYLRADGERIETWRTRLAPGGARLKVGLAWSGNPRFAAARTKACPVDQLVPLVETPHCDFFSLQKGEAASQVSRLNAASRRVIDYTGELDTFADTAALIDGLDLVITIDTVVAHLAGALGKPVWILLPYAADWRWLRGREDSPWYPTARLYRQPRIGDWDHVIQRVTTELARYNTG